MLIVIQLPEVKREKNERPIECSHCKGETFQRWGQHRKRIKDPKLKGVRVYRYCCTSCRRTFRHYPEGVSRAQQSERMKQLAVVCWALGYKPPAPKAVMERPFQGCFTILTTL